MADKLDDLDGNSEVIRETILFHFINQQAFRHVQFVRRFKRVSQMPFALVCTVITLLAHQIAKGRYIR